MTNLIIRKFGLMSAAVLVKKAIPSKMNSDELSRNLDAKAGLEDYVRLSFCSNNPMMHVARKEKRISNPVLLRIERRFVQAWRKILGLQRGST